MACRQGFSISVETYISLHRVDQEFAAKSTGHCYYYLYVISTEAWPGPWLGTLIKCRQEMKGISFDSRREWQYLITTSVLRHNVLKLRRFMIRRNFTRMDIGFCLGCEISGKDEIHCLSFYLYDLFIYGKGCMFERCIYKSIVCQSDIRTRDLWTEFNLKRLI